MSEVKFYEQGRVPGDYMGVLDRIEARREWAIVHDLSEKNWQVFVNGVSFGPSTTLREAEQLMQRFLDGTSRAPE